MRERDRTQFSFHASLSQLPCPVRPPLAHISIKLAIFCYKCLRSKHLQLKVVYISYINGL